jgi:hypothetical protein
MRLWSRVQGHNEVWNNDIRPARHERDHPTVSTEAE